MSEFENVTILEKGSKKYYIVGTAHISQKSVDEVAYVIDTIKPDTVCVELCETRHKALTEENQWKKLDVIQVIRQGKALMLLASLALSSFQRKMGSQLGVQPGAELAEAVKGAKRIGATLVLADRDIQITLKRTWANLGFWKKAVVLGGLLESVFTKEEITESDLEQLKAKDQISAMTEEFARAMPQVKEPLIDERDRYLMSKIEEAPGNKIVAVVGAGHVSGMQTYFGKTVDRAAIEVIPPPSWLSSALQWLVPLLIVGLFVAGFFTVDLEKFKEMIFIWFLATGVPCAIFTLIAGARPLTILSGLLSAPLTIIHPAISAGMVTAIIEGMLRKPTVEDTERMPVDIQSFRGFRRNPLTRVLLVFLLSNLGAALGSYLGITLVAKLLGS